MEEKVGVLCPSSGVLVTKTQVLVSTLAPEVTRGAGLAVPGRAGISQLLRDDTLLPAEAHQVLQDAMGKRHVQADVSKLIVHTLEALEGKEVGWRKREGGVTGQHKSQVTRPLPGCKQGLCCLLRMRSPPRPSRHCN